MCIEINQLTISSVIASKYFNILLYLEHGELKKNHFSEGLANLLKKLEIETNMEICISLSV